VANPGCYAAAALLALAPIAVRSRARASSSTRSPASPARAAGSRQSSHAGFVLENLSPYRVGTHQHAPEIEQALGFLSASCRTSCPVRPRLLVTCYVQPLGDLRTLLETPTPTRRRARARRRRDAGALARPAHDAAEIALYEDRATGRASSSA
jgi:hypothetical protein